MSDTPTLFRGPADSTGCATCPCAKDGQPDRPIRGAGKLKSLAIVGESPSTEDKHQGWPFVGASGKLLQQALSAGGIDRNSIWITNAILCQRPWDDEKLSLAVECCRPRLEHELSLVEPTAILALGGTAINALRLPVDMVTDARGTMQHSSMASVAAPIISSIHPSSILKGSAGEVSGGNQKMNIDAQYVFLEADVHKAWRLSQGVEPPWQDNIELLTTLNENTIVVITRFLDEARTWGMLGIDLEWNYNREITWLGIATKTRALSLYWPNLATDPVVFGLLRDAGAATNLPKLFHNLQADIGIWESRIGPIGGNVEDTMLMHHVAFPGAANDIHNVATQFLLVEPWKANRGNEEKQAVKDTRAADKQAKKDLKRLEHEARNLESHNNAVAKRKPRAAKSSASTDDILKLIGD